MEEMEQVQSEETRVENKEKQEVEQRAEINEDTIAEYLETIPLRKKRRIERYAKRLENWGLRVNTSCCSHYNSKKHFLAYYENTKIPLVYCENCGDVQSVGGFWDNLRLKWKSLFTSEFAIHVTDLELVDLDHDWRAQAWADRGMPGRSGSNVKKTIGRDLDKERCVDGNGAQKDTSGAKSGAKEPKNKRK